MSLNIVEAWLLTQLITLDKRWLTAILIKLATINVFVEIIITIKSAPFKEKEYVG